LNQPESCVETSNVKVEMLNVDFVNLKMCLDIIYFAKIKKLLLKIL